jgi:isopentenyl diphosphate isomerase/L-lactate dehydrogenase-like FMN-dependent dehydrogenase
MRCTSFSLLNPIVCPTIFSIDFFCANLRFPSMMEPMGFGSGPQARTALKNLRVHNSYQGRGRLPSARVLGSSSLSVAVSIPRDCGCEDEDEDYVLVFWVTRHLLPRIPKLKNAKYAIESSQKQKKKLEKRQEWVEKDKKASKKPNPRCIFAFSLLDAKPRHGGENLRRTSTSTINRREDRRDKRNRDR